jgi:hypothetical protein
LAGDVGVLDALVARVLGAYPYRFTLVDDADDRDLAYRIRYAAALDQGWISAPDYPDGRERDEHDATAVHILGWDGSEAVATGRLVFPPHPLPTEQVAGLVVEPRGRVADVGRMSVLPAYRSYRQAAFVALLCRLYLEMRAHGYDVACGMMSPRVRNLLRQLGLELQLLGPDQTYWSEQRAPVRFALAVNALSLGRRWSTDEDASEGGGARRPG